MDVSTNGGEAQWYRFRNIQVYARRDDAGRVPRADAIDQDREGIRGLADQLQKTGYGVLRERVSRAGRIYYRLRALWAGPGDPPANPPAAS